MSLFFIIARESAALKRFNFICGLRLLAAPFIASGGGGGHPETENACRPLPLAKDTVDVLNQQKKKAGSSPWGFPGPTGGPMSPDSVLHMLHRARKRAGLPKSSPTFATLVLQNGVEREGSFRVQRRVHPGHLRPWRPPQLSNKGHGHSGRLEAAR